MTLRVAAAAIAAITLAAAPMAFAADTPGVTKTEIKLGNTMPYSGPASAYGAIGRTEAAYFKMVNEHGGINGRKVDFESADDGYSPPKTVEETRRLVEQDQVAAMLGGLGTPSSLSVRKYLNSKKVPQIFLATGANTFGDYKDFPWTMGWQPSYRTEAQIYGKYILSKMPNAKIAVLWQNDSFGKDYLDGLKDVLGDKYATMVVRAASYEVSDPTVDQQITSLQGSGANALVIAATPKFAAQALRKVYDLGWKPAEFLTNVSASVGAVLKPAGVEKMVGAMSAVYLKDWTDPRWREDAGMKQWDSFMRANMPGADETDANYIYGYAAAETMMQVLKQCGDDLSRANIMKQAASLNNFNPGVLLPGITVNTSATNFHPIRQMQLAKWDGKTWAVFGELISGSGS